MSTDTSTLNMDGRYIVAGYRGIAFYLTGWSQEIPACECEEWCECEPYDSDSQVTAVMVGDDRTHVVDVDDLTEIEEDDYCHGCGQTGCGH